MHTQRCTLSPSSLIIIIICLTEKITACKIRRRRRWWTQRCFRKSSHPSMMRGRTWLRTAILRMTECPGVAPSDKSWPPWLPSSVPSTRAWRSAFPPSPCRNSRSQTASFPSRKDLRRNRGSVGRGGSTTLPRNLFF